MKIKDYIYSHSDKEHRELVEFLSHTYSLYRKLQNWSLNRIEDWKFGGNSKKVKTDPDFFTRNVHIWRNNENEIVGFCISEYGDRMDIQTHPDYRFLEEEMIDWAENVWASGKEKIIIPVYNYDAFRQLLLKKRGYKIDGNGTNMRSYDTSISYNEVIIPDGFTFKTLKEFKNIDSYVEAVRSAFGRETLDREWFDSKIKAPSFSFDWNICVISPDRKCASFCDVRIDGKNSYAEIDPIGTHPNFQRMRLSKACIMECFRRLRDIGIKHVYIASGPEPNPSNRLYESINPIEKYEEILLSKEL